MCVYSFSCGPKVWTVAGNPKGRACSTSWYGESPFSKHRPQRVPKVRYHRAFVLAVNEGTWCSTSLSALGGIHGEDFADPDRCVVASPD